MANTSVGPIYAKCNVCWGTGVTYQSEHDGQIEITCPQCGGVGKLLWGERELPEGFFYTSEIIESTDDAEYLALSSANKTRYQIIVSSGIVELSDETQIKSILWNMFGEGTTTRDNLEALLQ